MRIRLKGINRVTKRLKDGRRVTYHYAWKGGPALPGAPGSPEFVAAYNEAVARKVAPPQSVMLTLLRAFQTSQDFLGLAPRTRSDYIAKIRLIEKKFGDFPLSALADRRARGVFMAWRDQLAATSRRQADYAWVVLARVLSWSLDRGLIMSNPCEKGGRLYRGSRADKIWTVTDEAAFLAQAPKHLHLALLLALWTGQRQGDLLRLPWSAYDGSHIRLRQSKTGARVVIPVGAPLRAALDATAKRSTVILVNTDGAPWTADGFDRPGARRAVQWASSALPSMICAGRRSPGSQLPGAPRLRSPASRGIACGMSPQSWTLTICTEIRRSPRARFASSKQEQILPTDRPTGLCCSAIN
jgi:hypothetical protein